MWFGQMGDGRKVEQIFSQRSGTPTQLYVSVHYVAFAQCQTACAVRACALCWDGQIDTGEIVSVCVIFLITDRFVVCFVCMRDWQNGTC